jgi:hypothetical protein
LGQGQVSQPNATDNQSVIIMRSARVARRALSKAKSSRFQGATGFYEFHALKSNMIAPGSRER